MTLQDDARRLIGYHVVASDDEDLGTVEEVFYDNRTHNPEFVSVKSAGMFGRRESLVPLQGSQVSGEQLRVPFDKQRVKDAPDVGSGRDISPGEGEELYQHYGLRSSDVPAQQTGGPDTAARTGTAGTADAAADASAETAGTKDDATDAKDAMGVEDAHDTTTMDATAMPGAAEDAEADRMDGPRTDLAADTHTDTPSEARMGETAAAGEDAEEIVVTRSEERMHVGTERLEADRIHVHRRIETEDVERAVMVSREDVEILREPITDTDRVHASDLAEDELEIILYEERPVVSTESVPVERVRIKKTANRGQETVRARVRKERIDIMRDRDGAA
ncbi:MAG TPA: PRC and DUF2382 domain-containing protein [Streptosporangiaceae bacterium]|jgi:stress response protein YsnF